jgi:hypothetical protein
MIKDLHVNIYKNSRIVHIATIRNDWNENDFKYLDILFPQSYIKSAKYTIPLWYLGTKYHHTDFNSLSRLKLL